ncbi:MULTISPECIES: LysR family transcriptional regulator [Pseudomonas]|uniref:LysR family transcriptional regulator n=2 Tax=Pseudomonas gingeri TaxID=117681 RepID=A0A7Y8CCJ2_9PSED|nr:LysR family transcriptional regulator [Pseudomonas gingeri]NWC12971.1 LysR family transcriptional regulator [Pseudomonas gingeri]NWD52803.1 LysR family transcriptional regulator [Pseudomonas gingeri]NWE46506.1 LysR family transcriptional regulator [Pseudomonas gingeri]NWE69867.1 LysR family transcriptional regulator [Pseudomonas gingeri]PNQ90595.1 LysR family transcriptional regulator [Pseudomonas gingeri NCPPB 3146 = LMG 5327]
MDVLASMKVFVKVVDHGSFSAAAQSIGISSTMVGNHIQGLEKHLGTRLLHRTTRRQSLTEIGQGYYSQCLAILGQIEHAELIAREQRAHPRGRLRVSASATLASDRLIPAIAAYLKTYPEVDIELQFNDRVVDLVEDGFDVVFRYGELPSSGLVGRLLSKNRRIACASPAYLKAHGTPRVPADLQQHNCLVFLRATPQREWLFRGVSSESVRVHGQLSANNGTALMNAALEGIGIVLLPQTLVEDALKDGRLVHLLPDHETLDRPLHLVYLPDKHMTPKLSSFIEFMVGRFA